MRLVYFSPVPWNSFAQRPHKFVEWFHSRTNRPVLWIDPYPTRLPELSDFQRLGLNSDHESDLRPTWLSVMRPYALPIEPIPYLSMINKILWHEKIKVITHFVNESRACIVIGKPSKMAVQIINNLKNCISIYDAMDDFPNFYQGLSKKSQIKNERIIVARVSHVLASSRELQNKFAGTHKSVHLIKNGLDTTAILQAKNNLSTKKSFSTHKVFGYVGMMAKWFDWLYVDSIAKLRTNDQILLIGPVSHPPPFTLPQNVRLLPSCKHTKALSAMSQFDIGLIPFQLNELSLSVDPIKFYEYKAFGLPIISSNFGEMRYRKNESGVFVTESVNDLRNVIDAALEFRYKNNEINHFIDQNSWVSSFNKIDQIISF